MGTKKISVKNIFVYNTSLAALVELANWLLRRNACKIQNGQQWVRKHLCLKEFWDKKIYGPKKVLVQKQCDVQKMLSLKKFGLPLCPETLKKFWWWWWVLKSTLIFCLWPNLKFGVRHRSNLNNIFKFSSSIYIKTFHFVNSSFYP